MIQNASQTEQHFTTNTLCAFLRCGPDMIYSLIKAGLLQHRRKGRHYEFSYDHVRQYLAAAAVQPVTA